MDATHEEYAIHDYELPFKIGEYANIEELNRMAEIVEELQDTPIADVISELLAEGYYKDIEDLAEHVDDIVCYPDCGSMEDVAYYLIDECDALGEMSDKMKMYIDYEAYARDIEIEGNYVVTKHGVFELM